MREHVIAVDVGTGSARAGLFDRHGHMLARAEHPILMHRPHENHAEHQSENIWNAVCSAVRTVRQDAGIPPSAIAAIGFDATCSLVVRDIDGNPLPITAGGAVGNDTIVWLDHRAIDEALFCNNLDTTALSSTNGHMSPEMQVPKLMWLKKNLGARWNDIGHLFDLADFLTWKASGKTVRSACTLTAKWNFMSHETEGWSVEFLNQIGLSDLLVRGNLPERGLEIGLPIGPLSRDAAIELDLDEMVLVGPGMVDAYAGVLGSIGKFANDVEALEQQFVLVGGTSSCVVALSRDKKPGTGLWGPYYEALLSDMWLVEGGQSASGALLDYLVRMHASGGEPNAARHQAIIDRIHDLRAIEGYQFADGLHVLPDFHGNRSPFGNPHSAGVISGLSLDMSFDGLCKLYFRTALGIAFGMRQILEQLNANQFGGKRLHLAGGHTHNRLLMELYGEVCGYDIVLPPEKTDVVLLGTAMAASVIGGVYADISRAGQSMAFTPEIRPTKSNQHSIFDRDYQIFKLIQKQRSELAALTH